MLCLPRFLLQRHLARTGSGTLLSSEETGSSGRGFCCQPLGRLGGSQGLDASAALGVATQHLGGALIHSLKFCLSRSLDIIHSHEFIREKEEAAKLDTWTSPCPSVSEKRLATDFFDWASYRPLRY